MYVFNVDGVGGMPLPVADGVGKVIAIERVHLQGRTNGLMVPHHPSHPRPRLRVQEIGNRDGRQDADNGDHDEKFDEGEGVALGAFSRHFFDLIYVQFTGRSALLPFDQCGAEGLEFFFTSFVRIFNMFCPGSNPLKA